MVSYYGAGIRLAGAGNLSDVLERRSHNLHGEITGFTETYLMQVNETDLVAHLVEKHRIDPPVLHFDQMLASASE